MCALATVATNRFSGFNLILSRKPSGSIASVSVALSFVPPARCQVCSRAYLPFTCDHLPRVQSIVASCRASGSVIPVAIPGSGPIRQVPRGPVAAGTLTSNIAVVGLIERIPVPAVDEEIDGGHGRRRRKNIDRFDRRRPKRHIELALHLRTCRLAPLPPVVKVIFIVGIPGAIIVLRIQVSLVVLAKYLGHGSYYSRKLYEEKAVPNTRALHVM